MSDPALPPSERAPEGATVRRRWFPALAGGVLLAVVLLGLGWRTKQLLNLRRENESLRAATASLVPLQRLEKVDGQFKIVRTDLPTNPAPP